MKKWRKEWEKEMHFKLHKVLWIRSQEKYSRGRRGAPAKGIGRVTGARVQIPLSPLLFAIYVVRIFFEKVVDKRQTIW